MDDFLEATMVWTTTSGCGTGGMKAAWLRRGVALGVMVAGLAWVGATRADETGIRVMGSGTAKAKPTQVEIECTLSGEGELAADATVKFRDAKKRALAAIAALKNDDLAVVSDGIGVNSTVDENAQAMRQRGMVVASTKSRVLLTEKDRIVLSKVDKMDPDVLLDTVLKILDVAKDAGFQVSSGQNEQYGYQRQRSVGGVVTFKVPDPTAMRDQAYKDALEDAKSKATKLAELSGAKLGKVMSIQDTSGARDQGEDKSVVGATTGDISTTVNLVVTFEIVK